MTGVFVAMLKIRNNLGMQSIRYEGIRVEIAKALGYSLPRFNWKLNWSLTAKLKMEQGMKEFLKGE